MSNCHRNSGSRLTWRFPFRWATDRPHSLTRGQSNLQTDCGRYTISLVLVTIVGALPIGQTCKPLFPQELQSPQGPRMLHPICHTLPHFGIYLLVVFGQNYFHSLSVFIAAANLEIIFVTTKNPIKNLSKSAFFCFYFRLYVYSIGRIMLSIKAISSAVRLYLA